MRQRFTDSLVPAGREVSVGGGAEHRPDTEFCPAFKDERSGRVYLSRHADGSCAGVHLWEGLPEELIAARDAEGRVTALREGVVSGYVKQGRFFTREEARRSSGHSHGKAGRRSER